VEQLDSSKDDQTQKSVPVDLNNGIKVIQPLHPDIKPEVEERPAVGDSSGRAPSVVTEVDQAARINGSPSTYSPNHSYEEEGDTKDLVIDSGKNNTITVIVMILGALVVLGAIQSIFGSFGAVGSGGLGSILGIISLLLAVAELFIGIGLFQRKEVARKAYLIFAVVLLALSVYSTYRYFNASRQYSQTSVANFQQQITRVENNSSLSAAEKTRTIQSLQLAESQLSRTSSPIASTWLVIAESYLFAILPIIFLTRKSVKAVFA
jgi:hypothetical protein